MRLLAILVTVCSLFAIFGCSGAKVPFETCLPGIPEDHPDDAAYREASSGSTGQRDIEITEPYSMWRGWVQDMGDGVQYLGLAGAATGHGGLPQAYAIFKVPAIEQAGRRLETLVVESSAIVGASQYWLGLANYDIRAWEWYGPGNVYPEYNLDLTEIGYDFTSAMGNMYFIVVVDTGNMVHLRDACVLFDDGTTPPVNEPPVALLSADPVSGVAPLDVALDAGGSTDPEGGALSFDWDLDGDGVWDIEGATDPTSSHTYSGVGTYSPVVRVTDEGGLSDTDTVTVSVYPDGPTAVLLANGGSSPIAGTTQPAGFSVTFDATGSSSTPPAVIEHYAWDFDGDGVFSNEPGALAAEDAAYDDPGPAYVYNTVEPNGHHAKVRVTDTNGLTDIASVQVTPGVWHTSGIIAENFISSPNLAEINGKPAIVFYKNNERAFYYVSSTDSLGATWNSPVEIVSGNISGSICLNEVDGRPAVVNGWNRLRYWLANDAGGTSWPTPLEIETGLYNKVDLKIVNGHPAIACSEVEPTGVWRVLKYVRANDPLGSSWGTSIQLDGNRLDEYKGDSCSLEIVDGNPAIAYREESNYEEKLLFIRSTDANGTTWGSPQVIAGTEYVSASRTPIAFEIVNNHPAICYTGPTPGFKLRYVRANDAAGLTWPHPDDHPVLADVGGYTVGMKQMEILNGRPYCVGTTDRIPNGIFHSLDENGDTWIPAGTSDYTGAIYPGPGDLRTFGTIEIGPYIAAAVHVTDGTNELRFAIFY